MKSHNEQLNTFFSKTLEALHVSNSELCEYFGLNKEKKFSQQALDSIILCLDKLNVTLDSVIKGRVDFQILYEQFIGRSSMPSRYTKNALLSRRLTGKYMLDFIEKSRGVGAKRIILQHFQLQEDQFENLERENNILLPYDIACHVHHFYGEKVLFNMGLYSIEVLRKTSMGQILSQSRSMVSMIEHFLHDYGPCSVEKNYQWKIGSLTSSSCTISGQPVQEAIEEIGKKNISNKTLDVLRKGFFKALPGLVGVEEATVKQIKSISTGARADEYLLNYSPS